MKNFSLSAAVMLLCSVFLFSCTEKPIDENGSSGTQTGGGDTPGSSSTIYPEVRSFDVKAGDKFEISFESSLDWTASADVKWIVLSAESGKAGKSVVGCTITSDQPDYKADSKGNVTVKVAGKDFAFPVTRARMERSLRILKASQPVSALNFDANEDVSEIELTVEGDFYWDLDITANWPVWISRLGITDGKKGEDGIYRNTFTLSLNATELDGTDKTGALTFTDIDDASYTMELPVSYTAKIIPEVPFEIKSEFGMDIHVNKMGVFKNADGTLSSKVMAADFTVLTENTDELIVITPTGSRHGDGASFIQTEPNHRFVNVAKSGTPVEGGVNYTLVVTPGLLENSQPKSPCDMAYVFVLPKAIYWDYERFFQPSDPYYQMAFINMRIDNYLFEYMRDADGNQVSNDNGLVSLPKDSIRKYMLRIFIDAD